MSVESLISIWTWIYALGLGIFFAVALVLIPLGARDVWRLFHVSDDDDGESGR